MATYGTTMSWTYEDISDKGEPVTKKLVLVFNALTLIQYYNYVGREFMTDFYDVGFKSKEGTKGLSKELTDKIASGENINYEDISDEDLNALKAIDYSAHMEFFINLIAAMIATREYPKKVDFSEIISNEIPLFLLYDGDFINELVELVSFALKKNKLQFQRLGQRQAKHG